MAQTLLKTPKSSQRFLDSIFAPLLAPTSKQEQLTQIRSSVVLKKGVHYFDWTASGLASTLIEKRLAKLLPFYANAHSGCSKHADWMQEVYLHSKQSIKKEFGARGGLCDLNEWFWGKPCHQAFSRNFGGLYPP
ncbi:nifS-like protein [Helicobacter bizzozeronii CCUG 35545]|nr:nifS-like protein [Helicobacter bizzozeronii CCUG 35545]